MVGFLNGYFVLKARVECAKRENNLPKLPFLSFQLFVFFGFVIWREHGRITPKHVFTGKKKRCEGHDGSQVGLSGEVWP